MNEKNLILNQWLELADGDYVSAMHLLTLYPFREEVMRSALRDIEQIREFILPKFNTTYQFKSHLPI